MSYHINRTYLEEVAFFSALALIFLLAFLIPA